MYLSYLSLNMTFQDGASLDLPFLSRFLIIFRPNIHSNFLDSNTILNKYEVSSQN